MDALTLVMLGILALLIFFMFRNSRKRRQEMEKLQDKMVPGAEVMTNFGLFGTLVEIDEANNVATLELSPGNSVRVHRQTLARVIEDEPLDESLDEVAVHDDSVDEGPRLNESSVDPAPAKKTKKSDS